MLDYTSSVHKQNQNGTHTEAQTHTHEKILWCRNYSYQISNQIQFTKYENITNELLWQIEKKCTNGKITTLQQVSKQTKRKLSLLISASKLWLGPTQEVCNEVCFTAHVDVVFVGATAEALVQGSAVALLFTAVQLTHQNVVSSQHLVFAVGAKPDGWEK